MKLALFPKQPVTQWLPEFTESPRELDVNLNTPPHFEGSLGIRGAGISLFSYTFSRPTHENMYLYLHFEEEDRSFHNYFSKFYVCWLFLCFVGRLSLYNLVNRTNFVHKFSQYVYCFSLRVSGNYVPIIRTKYRTYAATPVISHSIQMTVWYAGRNEDSLRLA